MTIATTSPTSSPTPRWLRDLTTGQVQYQELLGWPVTVDIEHRRLAVTVGQSLGAVVMPAGLGRRVLVELRTMMPAGAVISGPGTWWTFLTEPAHASRPSVPGELRRAAVRLAPHGAQVIIPTRIDGDRPVTWIEAPQSSTPLPPLSVVIGATRRAVENRHLMIHSR